MIDYEYLKEVSGGDTEFEKYIVATYLEVAPDLVGQLESALESADSTSFIQAVHTLKGSSSSIGAKAFSEECRKVEMAVRNGELEDCRPMVPKLLVCFGDLQEKAEAFVAAA